MQPIYQNLGRFIQQQIHTKYRNLLIKQENELKLKGTIKKLVIGQTRIMISKWMTFIWKDLCTNHKHLISSSWSNTGLQLNVNGTEDFEFLNKICKH